MMGEKPQTSHIALLDCERIELATWEGWTNFDIVGGENGVPTAPIGCPPAASDEDRCDGFGNPVMKMLPTYETDEDGMRLLRRLCEECYGAKLESGFDYEQDGWRCSVASDPTLAIEFESTNPSLAVAKAAIAVIERASRLTPHPT